MSKFDQDREDIFKILYSILDQDREDIIKILYFILGYAKLGYEISAYDNCNNCKRKNCEYRPRWWQTVRWNCPLWKGGEE